MYISSINLNNFRNYEQFALSFDKSGSVFYGDNGTGKTNLLEAICYFAYGKSFRVNSDIDLISYDKDFFRIKGLFVHHNDTFTFEAALDRRGQKLIKINDRKIDRISELYNLLKVVFFSQEDINLISGAPKKRRHYFDLAIAQYNYKYIDELKSFNQIIKQRNALLKTKFSAKEKKVWDEQFLRISASLINHRMSYLTSINNELSGIKLTTINELIEVRYILSFNLEKNKPLTEQMTDLLKKNEREEIEQGRTILGPHLDDYQFFLNGLNISRFGSHGQKRCLVILLGLAQASLLTKNDMDSSIMIFDDVLSDLDETRTKAIISQLNDNNQIFIATPNPKPYQKLHLPLIDINNNSVGNSSNQSEDYGLDGDIEQ